MHLASDCGSHSAQVTQELSVPNQSAMAKPFQARLRPVAFFVLVAVVACLGVVLPNFVGPAQGSKRSPRQLSISRTAGSEDAALVADAGASPLLAPLKVASLGMGLLKPIFAAEAKLQALTYDEAEIQAKVQEDVKSAPVVVYTYGLSPFCTEATKLLDSLGAEYKEIQLAPEWFLMLGENAAKRAELGTMYGRRLAVWLCHAACTKICARVWLVGTLRNQHAAHLRWRGEHWGVDGRTWILSDESTLLSYCHVCPRAFSA